MYKAAGVENDFYLSFVFFRWSLGLIIISSQNADLIVTVATTTTALNFRWFNFVKLNWFKLKGCPFSQFFYHQCVDHGVCLLCACCVIVYIDRCRRHHLALLLLPPLLPLPIIIIITIISLTNLCSVFMIKYQLKYYYGNDQTRTNTTFSSPGISCAHLCLPVLLQVLTAHLFVWFIFTRNSFVFFAGLLLA